MKDSKLSKLKLEKNVISNLSLKTVEGGSMPHISLASRQRQCNETFLC